MIMIHDDLPHRAAKARSSGIPGDRSFTRGFKRPLAAALATLLLLSAAPFPATTVAAEETNDPATAYSAYTTRRFVFQESLGSPSQTIELALLEAKTGDEANAFVEHENFMNRNPAADEEWIVLRFHLRYVSGAGFELKASRVLKAMTSFFNRELEALCPTTTHAASFYESRRFDPHDIVLSPGEESDFLIGILLKKTDGYPLYRIPTAYDASGHPKYLWFTTDPSFTPHVHAYQDGLCTCGDRLFWSVGLVKNAYIVTKYPSAPVWSMPITSHGSVQVRRIAHNGTVVVREVFRNRTGALWYWLADGEFIYSGNVKLLLDGTKYRTTASFSGWDIPDRLSYRLPYSIGGTVTASNTIDNVNVRVLDAAGRAEIDVDAAVGSTTFQLKDMDDLVLLRTLTDGAKTFEIWVDHLDGHQKVYEKGFTVSRPEFAIPFELDRFGVSSVWGYRVGYADLHMGIDLINRKGSAVLASADGIVRLKQTLGGYGNVVYIEHELDWTLWQTRYAHLDSFDAALVVGGTVRQYDAVGIMGNTGHSGGTHLHFEIGRLVISGKGSTKTMKPVDPESQCTDLIPYANRFRDGGTRLWEHYTRSGGTTVKP